MRCRTRGSSRERLVEQRLPARPVARLRLAVEEQEVAPVEGRVPRRADDEVAVAPLDDAVERRARRCRSPRRATAGPDQPRADASSRSASGSSSGPLKNGPPGCCSRPPAASEPVSSAAKPISSIRAAACALASASSAGERDREALLARQVGAAVGGERLVVDRVERLHDASARQVRGEQLARRGRVAVERGVRAVAARRSSCSRRSRPVPRTRPAAVPRRRGTGSRRARSRRTPPRPRPSRRRTPTSAASSASDSGPREFAIATSCPASTASRANVAPIRPLPITPMRTRRRQRSVSR